MLSFIIPAYNEEHELGRTIASIRAAAEEASQEYEIIVVDDGSTDATAEIGRGNGAHVVEIQRRHIAAARNAGANAASGEILFFVDADTRISPVHVIEAVKALGAGYSGGSARVKVDGVIPIWAKVFIKLFCVVYFAIRLGAGAFLFTSRKNFNAVGGFDEQLFIGEEVFLSLALKKLGKFTILREPILTSGRKLRMYSAREILGRSFWIIATGRRAASSRHKLDLWYEGKRESR